MDPPALLPPNAPGRERGTLINKRTPPTGSALVLCGGLRGVSRFACPVPGMGLRGTSHARREPLGVARVLCPCSPEPLGGVAFLPSPFGRQASVSASWLHPWAPPRPRRTRPSLVARKVRISGPIDLSTFVNDLGSRAQQDRYGGQDELVTRPTQPSSFTGRWTFRSSAGV